MDNLHYPCNLAERQRLRREYVDKWSDPANMADFHHEVPLEHESSNLLMTNPGINLVACCSDSNRVSFTRVPPAMSGKPTER